MGPLAVLLALAAAPLKMAVPEAQAVGIEPKMVAFLTEHLASQLKLAGIDVVTSREIATLLGLERQAALMGCDSKGTNCMVELANALGAKAVMLVDLARLGDKTQVNVKVIAAGDGHTLSVYAERVQGDEAIADALARAAQQISSELLPSATPSRGALGRLGWIPVGVGAGLLLGGGITFGLGKSDYGTLTGAPTLGAMQAVELRDGGRTKEQLGVGLLIAGAAVLAIGALLLVLGRSSD